MEERKIIKHIIFVVLIVILSGILWHNADINKAANIAREFDNRQVLLTFDGFTTLPNIDDKYYKELDTYNINLKNIDKDNKEYKLYFVFSKTSSVDFNTIKMDLDNEVIKLSDIKYNEDDDYIYFLVKEGSIEAYKSIDMPVRIWTSSEDGSLRSSFRVK